MAKEKDPNDIVMLVSVILIFLGLAFGFGLAAVFTPCVFPMIPITMSYFVGQKGGFGQAVTFCLGIVVLFTGLGLVATAVLGPAGVNHIGANVWVNAFRRAFGMPYWSLSKHAKARVKK